MFSRVMLFLALLTASAVTAFVPITRTSMPPTLLHAEASSVDPNEVVARRIIVTGDVQGGYYRSCVQNEVGRVLCNILLDIQISTKSIGAQLFLSLCFRVEDFESF